MSMPARSKSCSLSGLEAGIHVGHQRVQLRHAGVDQHARIGMVDDVHVDRHPLALGEQVGNADRRNGDRGGHVHWDIVCQILRPLNDRFSSRIRVQCVRVAFARAHATIGVQT